MNRIAVILRGDLRTWNYAKPAIFAFWESIADNVDYYFATWRTPTLDITSLRKDFENKNLIALITLNPGPVDNPYSGWTGPSTLCHHVVPYKRMREKTVTYDAVFETRPDVIYTLLDGKKPIAPDHNTLFSSNLVVLDDKNRIGVGDFFFAMSSNVFDILSQRFAMTTTETGTHYDIRKICDSEGIDVCCLDWVEAQIVRPNGINDVKNPFDYFTASHLVGENDWAHIQQRWNKMSRADKIKCLQEHNIAVTDYLKTQIDPVGKPYKRIAVVLRGHMRTWRYTKDVIFDFFESIADNVDYYLATWMLPSMEEDPTIIDDIHKSFIKRNLIRAEFVSPNTPYYQGTSLTSAWLTYKLLPYKQEREKSVKYDVVFETRPDVVFRKFSPNKNIDYTIDNNTLYTVLPSPREVEPGVFKLFLEDYFLVSDSKTFDLLTTRYTHPTVYRNTQISLGVAAESKGITLKKLDWVQTAIVRPSLMDSGIPSGKILEPEWDASNRNGPEWASYTNEEKIRISNKHRIDLEDYKCSGSGEFKIT